MNINDLPPEIVEMIRHYVCSSDKWRILHKELYKSLSKCKLILKNVPKTQCVFIRQDEEITVRTLTCPSCFSSGHVIHVFDSGKWHHDAKFPIDPVKFITKMRVNFELRKACTGKHVDVIRMMNRGFLMIGIGLRKACSNGSQIDSRKSS